MTRKEFIQQGLALGLGLPFISSLLSGCEGETVSFPQFQSDFEGKVIIVGAGAAGLAAGYLLHRLGVDFQIIEASDRYGGRVKRTDSFADFPIDLGAEWIHASPKVLSEILNDPNADAQVEFVTYNPQKIGVAQEGEVRMVNAGNNFYSEIKFKDSTWFGFFEQHIVPKFLDRIVLDTPIKQIDYAQDRVLLTAQDNSTFEADRVLVTVPIKILQTRNLEFVPALPVEKTGAIDSISMGDGLKAFIEFSEKFYPDILLFGGLLEALATDSKTYYDAAFRKDSQRHVLGLFTINEPASRYTGLGSDEAIIAEILAELDALFDGKASPSYLQHVIQNWSAEPYVQGSYSYNFADDQTETVNALLTPLDGKVYFAGEALSIDSQATVHGACESAYSVVERMLGS